MTYNEAIVQSKHSIAAKRVSDTTILILVSQPHTNIHWCNLYSMNGLKLHFLRQASLQYWTGYLLEYGTNQGNWVPIEQMKGIGRATIKRLKEEKH